MSARTAVTHGPGRCPACGNGWHAHPVTVSPLGLSVYRCDQDEQPKQEHALRVALRMSTRALLLVGMVLLPWVAMGLGVVLLYRTGWPW